MTRIIIAVKGGAGSGNWGHTGRPGMVGGSGGRAGPTLHARVIGTDKHKTFLMDAIGQVPQDHLDLVKGIDMTKVAPVHGLGGAADLVDYTIELFRDKPTGGRMWSGGDVLHEIGHLVLERYAGFVDSDIMPDMYNQLQTNTGLSAGALQASAKDYTTRSGFPSAYSQINHQELFAEGYRMYINNPVKLQRTSLDVYTFLRDEIFYGEEYTE